MSTTISLSLVLSVPSFVGRETINSVWAGDITFIPTSKGWLYLAVVIDLCSRRIVGWSLADNLRAELVVEAMNQALKFRQPNHTIFHSDRGSQYGSASFRAVLKGAGYEPKYVSPC